MRVALISSSFYPATFYGGPVSATWDLSRKLGDQGIEVYVSTTNANGKERLRVKTNEFINKGKNLFVKYYHEQIINRFSFKYILGLWKDIAKSDLVYIQYLFHYTVFFALIYSFLQNKKIIICPRGSFSHFTLHYKWSLLKSLWLSVLIKPLCKDVCWHVSSYLEEQDILKLFPKADIKVINDGIDYNTFQDIDKLDKKELLYKFTNHNFEKISHIFFSMGRLHKIKRFDAVIDAFVLFLNDYPDAKLLIAGPDDGCRNNLLKQIQDLHLSNSVFLIGSLDFRSKCLVMGNVDLFILASYFESFGIVVAESLACGTPVVVSNNTPWKDIEKNKCGIFTESEYDGLYLSFKRFLDMEFDSNMIRNYVRVNYDWHVIVKKFINLIKSQ